MGAAIVAVAAGKGDVMEDQQGASPKTVDGYAGPRLSTCSSPASTKPRRGVPVHEAVEYRTMHISAHP